MKSIHDYIGQSEQVWRPEGLYQDPIRKVEQWDFRDRLFGCKPFWAATVRLNESYIVLIVRLSEVRLSYKCCDPSCTTMKIHSYIVALTCSIEATF